MLKDQSLNSTLVIRDIPLDEIRDNTAPVRPIDDDAVALLAESMSLIGQQSPIVVTSDHRLISGRHRVAAQSARGEKTISAVVIDLPDVPARVATLDENLVRLELTPLQRGEVLAERKQLYEWMHPDSRHGRGNGNAVAGFTRAMAEMTGKGRSTIAEYCQIGEMSQSVRSLIRRTPLEHRKTQLLEIARMPSEAAQLRACRSLLEQFEPPGMKLIDVQELLFPERVESGHADAGGQIEPAASLLEEAPAGPHEVSADTSGVAPLLERALEQVEEWLEEAQGSPQAENRFVGVAAGLATSSASFLERAANGIESPGRSSAVADRMRRAAAELVDQARRIIDELLLIQECTCRDGCSACEFAGGRSASDLRRERPLLENGRKDPEFGSC